MLNIVSAFQSLISPVWELDKNGSYYQVKEFAKNTKNKAVSIGGCTCFAYSLDVPGENPWPFFRSDPPRGVAGKVDCIIVAHYKGANYCFALDLKSTEVGSAYSQIYCTKLKIDWLVGLLKEFTEFSGEYKFLGIISYMPRKIPSKRTTRRNGPKVERHGKGFDYVKYANKDTINLVDIFQSL